MSATLPLLTPDQLRAYFDRIGFTAAPAADLTTLQALHNLHPQHIPFENLSSLTGATVSLQPDQVFAKLVSSRRGGYCFEHNQLFMRVLQSIGFPVQGLSCRVRWMLPPETCLPRTHMALLVETDGNTYLADVGFGGVTMTAALELADDRPQTTPHEDFRLERTEDMLYSVSVCIARQWQRLYTFSRDVCLPPDYETANWFVSTHPGSRFVTQLICCRVDAGGRHALLNNRYSYYRQGEVPQARELEDADALQALLREQFLIDTSGITELDSRLQQLCDTSPAAEELERHSEN